MSTPRLSSDTYFQGHAETVTRTYTNRTATNSAAFLLPYLKNDMVILDVGCGPGTITSDFCKFVPQGSVMGVDTTAKVLDQARSLSANKEVENLKFEVGNVIDGLKYPDGSFDVLYCHQMLIHLPDPIVALKEMKRLCKPNGVVACRECIWGSMQYYPPIRGVELLKVHYAKLLDAAGTDGDAGRSLHVWARKAGFESTSIQKSCTATLFSSQDERKWFADAYGDRIKTEAYREKLDRTGANGETVEEVVMGLDEWATNEDGWLALMHGEILCWNTRRLI